jgi:hypothetical protein
MNHILTQQISLILLPYDDLTDRVIKEPLLSVYLDHREIAPVRKKEGFLIFTDLDNPIIRLKILSARYHPFNTVIDLTNLNPLHPVLLVCLKPGAGYIQPLSTSLISGYVRDKKGRLLKQCPVTVQHNWEGGRIQLTEDTSATGKGRLRLAAPQFKHLPGRQFVIQDVKTRILERFLILQHYEDSHIYILDTPLSKHYPAGTLMFQLTELVTDDEGRFVFYMQTPRETGGQIKISAKQGGQKAEYVFAPPTAFSTELPDLILQ